MSLASFSKLEPGSLLIATRRLQDPNFHRAVVLICQHDDQGSMGLIINRPTPFTPDKLFEEEEEEKEAWKSVGNVFQGGPVQVNGVLMLHRLGETVPGSVPVLGDLSLGGDWEVLRSAVRSGNAGSASLRLFVGYAGWGPGQCESEIGEGAWIVKKADPSLVFATDPLQLWGRLLGTSVDPFNFPSGPDLN